MGFPIRQSPGQRLFAPIRRLTQPTTAFIASRYLGIHHTSLVTWTLDLPPNKLSKNKHPFRIFAIYIISVMGAPVKGRHNSQLFYPFFLICQDQKHRASSVLILRTRDVFIHKYKLPVCEKSNVSYVLSGIIVKST